MRLRNRTTCSISTFESERGVRTNFLFADCETITFSKTMKSSPQPPKRRRKVRMRRSGPAQRKLGRIGRPSKLGQIDSEKLISDIAEGVAVAIACAAQGIHRDTFYSWLEEQPEFAVKLAAAKREVILKAIAGIRTGSKDDEWRGHAWFLEHVYPDLYAPPADKGFHLTQNNLVIGELDEARRILDAAKALPYRSETNERSLA
jgi:hypothetical protein